MKKILGRILFCVIFLSVLQINQFKTCAWYESSDKTCSIVYDNNGDLYVYGYMGESSVKVGETFTLPKNKYSRSEYKFVGWNTKKDGTGTVYEDEAQITITEDMGYSIKLYAQWETIKYEVIYDSNGGKKGKMYSANALCDKKFKLSENSYSRPGYKFVCWNTQADGKGTKYNDEQEVVNLANGGEKITLYAQWKKSETILKKVEKVSYKSNGLDFSSTKGVRYYEIYRSTSKNKGFKKIATCKTTFDILDGGYYCDDKAKAGQTYYYKVRGYITENGKKVYLPFSKVKKIKTALKPNFSAKYEIGNSGYKMKTNLCIKNNGSKKIILDPLISVYPYDTSNASSDGKVISKSSRPSIGKKKYVQLSIQTKKRYYSDGARIVFAFTYDDCVYVAHVTDKGKCTIAQ